ncbi:bifunctional nuclease family protein [Candidatus Saganbacteria bacterium]|nr:bifunctional nuclease family protein [Candidatus Saganbacteria bacterium]
MIELHVGGLGFDPRNLSPLVLLQDQEELNFLPIWIGIFEAAAIAMEMQGTKPPRPMTHDLLKNFVEALDGRLHRALISDVKEGTFFAIVEIEKNGKILQVDARPSDAIALAVRAHIPILVSEVVMMQAKLVNAQKDADETKKFKDFIQDLKPEDFTKYYKKD